MTTARWAGPEAGRPTHRHPWLTVRAGRPLPFGATVVPGGVNFAVHANRATAMTLVLFAPGAVEPFAELPFPDEFRVGGVHAMTVSGIRAGEFEYGYRADGPYRPEDGDRFDPNVVLVDPYATLLTGGEVWGRRPDPTRPTRWRGALAEDDFDWRDDRPPRLAHEDLVVYETHVRGFTRHPSSEVARPGTFAGLAEKIPHLTGLGVNCVELMPVFEFDEFENSRLDNDGGEPLYNYWGYSTVGFFAPKASYAGGGAGSQVRELKELVRLLHAAGIEVILDVVFNHTAEGNEFGPTISFRGLDNRAFYLRTPDGGYHNFSGTGNTLNCNNPVVRGFVLDCLRYWVSEFHVDGFRFDLAAVLVRGEDGAPLDDPPLVAMLAGDPVLRDCKLIAEAWDAAGLYRVGSFPHHRRWAEWNGQYRDTLRRFVKGDPGTASEMATRLVGSPDLYGDRGPAASVNFVTAHDGFTLADLFSYNEKHNDANGECGRDGDNGNHSWNCGHEGPTGDPAIRALRARMVRNALVLLLTSRGVPMLLAGDEFGRTQCGNNNAYRHDGELSWLDWSMARTNADLVRFTSHVIAFRHAHPALRRDFGSADVRWHGLLPDTPDWSPERGLIAVTLTDHDGDVVHVVANAHWEGQELRLPDPPEQCAWHLFADTSAASPSDVSEPGAEPPLIDQARLWAGPRSVVVLTARQPAHAGGAHVVHTIDEED
jgi:glycogen operon protein